jgi:hypothetical protein
MGIPMKSALAVGAAVCGFVAAPAFGQTQLERFQSNSLNQSDRALVNNEHSASFGPAFDRAFRTPLEIVWLRAASEAEMWNSAQLAAAVQRCGPSGSAREGCAVLGRTAFRYVFGGNAPTIDGAARLIVSSLNLPGSTFVSGRMNIVGTGRIYVVTPPPEKPGMKPASGAIVLAAGSHVQIVDVAQPSIQVELKAPDDQALLLGSLASTDLGKVLSLIASRGGATSSASEAVVSESGKVALRGAGELQFAMIAPRQSDSPVTALAKAEAPALSLAKAEIPVSPLPGLAGTAQPAGVERAARPAPVAGAVGIPTAESSLLASLAPSARAGSAQVASAALAAPVAVRSAVQVPAAPAQDVAWAVAEAVLAQFAQADRGSPGSIAEPSVVVASVVPTAPLPAVPVSVASPVAPSAPATVEAVKVEAPVIASVDATAAPAPKAAPIVVAAAAPAPKAASSDVARMRAEVEAEVRREQERLAQMVQQTRTIGTPVRRFSFGT